MLLFFTLAIILPPVTLFSAAGRLDWPMGWTFITVQVASGVISRLILFRTNPDLLTERARSLKAPNAKPWDRKMVVMVGFLGPLITWIVAGLDWRLYWSLNIGLLLQLSALAVVLAGYAFGTWAMVVNPFFSAVVRIQTDRGHSVISSGPYRLVRHPAYAGAVAAYLAIPISLDSLWALIPASLTAILFLVRTWLEDRTLKEELPGYKEYAQNTRYRLVPGIW